MPSPNHTLKKQENAYFAAANGYTGFRSYYGSTYPSKEHTRIFVIKGGPGTGKSRLLRECAIAAEEIGAAVTYYYCSSDPTSLDGVTLVKGACRIAVLDGTSPHQRCADIPGAVDELLNLGDFWDPAPLVKERSRILSLMQKKSDAFATAYAYLRLAGEAAKEKKKLLSSVVDHIKLQKSLLRLLKQNREKSGAETRVLVGGIGMRGRVDLPTLSEQAERIYLVKNSYGFSELFLSHLRTLLLESKTAFASAESPLSPDITDAIFLPENKILFCAENALPFGAKPDKIQNPARFFTPSLLKEKKPDLKKLSSLEKDLLLSAEASFRFAGESHFALEELYIAAMNFEEKENRTLRLVKRILQLLSEEVDKNQNLC